MLSCTIILNREAFSLQFFRGKQYVCGAIFQKKAHSPLPQILLSILHNFWHYLMLLVKQLKNSRLAKPVHLLVVIRMGTSAVRVFESVGLKPGRPRLKSSFCHANSLGDLGPVAVLPLNLFQKDVAMKKKMEKGEPCMLPLWGRAGEK